MTTEHATKPSETRVSDPADCSPPEWLLGRTFVVEYSPNCNRKWMVRLVGFRKGRIDKIEAYKSDDAIGYGDTLAQAAESAIVIQKHQKEAFAVR